MLFYFIFDTGLPELETICLDNWLKKSMPKENSSAAGYRSLALSYARHHAHKIQ